MENARGVRPSDSRDIRPPAAAGLCLLKKERKDSRKKAQKAQKGSVFNDFLPKPATDHLLSITAALHPHYSYIML
jgi:hypothetical protein